MDKKTRETGTNRLTDTKVKTAKAETKESTLPDGEGLELRVKPNGGKRWVFKYQRPADKKRTNMGFGTYPEVSLAAARERRREARALLAQSIDPKQTFGKGHFARSGPFYLFSFESITSMGGANPPRTQTQM
ncbi:Arm DNA-binding domain-containing protein [Aeromonas salmonicida]|uniref:Arm DNA-binding domain-containing protein n=1 Tax=Aeromonas salmonicida TaxID=645 RepID=UPI003416FE2E